MHNLNHLTLYEEIVKWCQDMTKSKPMMYCNHYFDKSYTKVLKAKKVCVCVHIIYQTQAFANAVIGKVRGINHV